MKARPQVPKQVQVELPEDLAADLAAFSATYYEAQYAPILRIALREHIERTLDSEPGRKRIFERIRTDLLKAPGDTIRLLPTARGADVDAKSVERKNVNTTERR